MGPCEGHFPHFAIWSLRLIDCITLSYHRETVWRHAQLPQHWHNSVIHCCHIHFKFFFWKQYKENMNVLPQYFHCFFYRNMLILNLMPGKRFQLVGTGATWLKTRPQDRTKNITTHFIYKSVHPVLVDILHSTPIFLETVFLLKLKGTANISAVCRWLSIWVWIKTKLKEINSE